MKSGLSLPPLGSSKGLLVLSTLPPLSKLPPLSAVPTSSASLSRSDIKPLSKETVSILSPTPIVSEAPSTKLPPLPGLGAFSKLPIVPSKKEIIDVLSPTPVPSEAPSTILPPLPSGTLVSSLKTTLPPITSLEVSPLPKVSLPPFRPPERLKEGAEPVVVVSPLASEVRLNKEEQIQKIGEEVAIKEMQQSRPSIIGIPEDIKPLMETLQPLSNLPVFTTKVTTLQTMPKLPVLPVSSPGELGGPATITPSISSPQSAPTSLQVAQEGVKTAQLIEPSASFQKGRASKKVTFQGPEVSLPPLNVTSPVISLQGIGSQEASPQGASSRGTGPQGASSLQLLTFPLSGDSLTVIASPANLPSTRSKESTPRIRIPKIKASPVRPMPPKKSTATTIGGIELPTTSTVITPIPIASPSAATIAKVSTASVSNTDMIENIMKIDLNKLIAERAGKNESYSVAELKSIAGSLNLTKTGSKKELVERIKNAISSVRSKK